MLSLEDAAAMALALPGVVEGSTFRHRAWTVAGKAFAWERPFSKADVRRFGAEPVPAGPILAVRTADLAEKEAVLGSASTAVFTIEHFAGYPAVLVRLDAADPDEVRELLLDAWLALAPEDLAATHLGRRPER